MARHGARCAAAVLFALVLRGGSAISFFPQQDAGFNGTTTLEEQATAGRDAPSDKNRIFINRYKPIVITDNTISANGGNLGVWRPPPGPYFRPRPPNLNGIAPPPPVLDHEAPDKLYQLGGGYPGGFPGGGGYPIGAYPGDFVNPYPNGGGDQCNIIAPLLAFKKALFKVIKVAAIKLPLIALKVVTKIFTVLVLLGPIMLPLLLLFPVPVYGFANGFNNINTGFGNSFANNVPNNNNFNNGNNNLNRNPNNPNNNNGNLGRKDRQVPPLAKGPCFPRIACELGYWGYQPQIAWILDHVHETVTPIFPKIFQMWKRAYHQGGKGLECRALYACANIDQLVKVAQDAKLLPRE